MLKIGVISVALIVLASAGFFGQWHVRLARSLNAILANGDPLLPADMVVPQATRGTDSVAWLAPLRDLEETADHGHLFEVASVAAMAERARSGMFRAEIATARMPDVARPRVSWTHATANPCSAGSILTVCMCSGR